VSCACEGSLKTSVDFDPKKMRDYFSNKLQEGKEVAADLKPSKA